MWNIRERGVVTSGAKGSTAVSHVTRVLHWQLGDATDLFCPLWMLDPQRRGWSLFPLVNEIDRLENICLHGGPNDGAYVSTILQTCEHEDRTDFWRGVRVPSDRHHHLTGVWDCLWGLGPRGMPRRGAIW